MTSNIRAVCYDLQELQVPAARVTIGYMTNDQKERFAQRLNLLLDRHDFPPKGKGRQIELAKIFGVSQKGARKWLEAESIPTHQRLVSIAEHFGGSTQWLAFGEGSPTGVAEELTNYSTDSAGTVSRDERILIEKYRHLSIDDRARLQAIITALDAEYVTSKASDR